MISEKAFQKQVEDYLKLKGVLYLHLTTYMKIGRKGNERNISIPGMTGWPDLLIFFNKGCVAMELKVGENTLTKTQEFIKHELWFSGYKWHTVYTFEKAREIINLNLYRNQND